MHTLQPKHIKLKSEEVKKLVDKYKIALSQLPIIKGDDPALPAGCVKGDVIKIERKEDDKEVIYYRVVV